MALYEVLLIDEQADAHSNELSFIQRNAGCNFPLSLIVFCRRRSSFFAFFRNTIALFISLSLFYCTNHFSFIRYMYIERHLQAERINVQTLLALNFFCTELVIRLLEVLLVKERVYQLFNRIFFKFIFKYLISKYSYQ